jgi:hypothetical protein
LNVFGVEFGVARYIHTYIYMKRHEDEHDRCIAAWQERHEDIFLPSETHIAYQKVLVLP